MVLGTCSSRKTFHPMSLATPGLSKPDFPNQSWAWSLLDETEPSAPAHT